MLFTHSCTACHKVQLIFPSQAHAVTATPAGPELTFTCWCGAEQRHLMRDGSASRGEVELIA
ncbi:hypothetical protein [Nocardioides campestrisoli]|uniref:hypothetical protein n=1 Tax=Nocardioides campestrisoli TaxID=2736757 RepID=UPI0015E705B1|nr:hypothetical protein [Nocardioides campestrisoli]